MRTSVPRDRQWLEERRLLAPPHGRPDAEAAVDADVRRLETELAEKLGAKVAFRQQASGRGQLIISYSSLDELDGILAHIR